MTMDSVACLIHMPEGRKTGLVMEVRKPHDEATDVHQEQIRTDVRCVSIA